MHIKKDEKKSGATGDIPCKPCFGGAKARNFFLRHVMSKVRLPLDFHKDSMGGK